MVSARSAAVICANAGPIGAAGSSIAPYASLMLAALRGRETEAAELIEIAA